MEAEDLYREAFETLRETCAVDDLRAVLAARGLADTVERLHPDSVIEALHRELHEDFSRALGGGHPASLATLDDLIGTLARQDKNQEALRFARAALSATRERDTAYVHRKATLDVLRELVR